MVAAGCLFDLADDFVFSGETAMSRGGWRWGAGRPAYKGKAEACMRIDVREWHRRGTLRPGYSGT